MFPATAAAGIPMMKPSPGHRAVLVNEVVNLLAPSRRQVIVDGTLGAGGHAEALLEHAASGARLYGVDRDPSALELATRRMVRFGSAFTAIRGDHRDLVPLLRERDVFVVDAVLLDLGLSSMQLDDPSRGFAIRHDGPLDMRMDPAIERSAADLVADSSENELARILRVYGEERRARRIARAIVAQRARQPLETTAQLAALVERAAGPSARAYRIHPATRTFQALRIAVNDEVSYLDTLVRDVASILRRGGRMACIAYHSLEDRAIKLALRSLAHRCVCPPELPVCGCGRENVLRLVTSRAVRPTDDEVQSNPRARSARLRVAERV